MEQKYSVTGFSIELLDDIPNMEGWHSDYDKRLIGNEFIKATALKDEVFYCWTYFNEGEFDKNIISRLSYNFIPRRIFLHHISTDPKVYLECLQNFRKLNKHFAYKIGICQTDQNDFLINCCTQEIIVGNILEQ